MAGVRPVKIVQIDNPFQASARTAELQLSPRVGESLAECLRRISVDLDNCVVSLNGQLIQDGEFEFHPVLPGAEIVCASAAGGGALKMVAMIGVMVAAAAFSGGLGGVLEAAVWNSIGFGAVGISASTAALVGTAISIGGNMLISATMGGSSGGTKSPGVTYDPDGPKTLAQPGTPIPKAYGTMGWGGNIISGFVDQDGQDEYLNVLVSFGFGVATGMSNILLNGKPIGAYPDLNYAMRLGSNSQTPIHGFDRIVNTYSQQVELLAANGPTIAAGQGLTTTGLTIAVKFPGGLMRTDSGGNPKECSLAYKVEISPGGQNQWTTPIFPRTTADIYSTDANGFQHFPYWVVMPTDRFAGSGIVYSTDTNHGAHTPGEPWSMTQSVKVYNVDNTNYTYSQLFQGEWQMTSDIGLDLQSVTDWWGGYRIVSNMTNQSFYDVVNILGLSAGKWDVRVTKYGAGPHNQPIPAGDGYMTNPHYTADAWLWDVSELQFADLAYPNMILLGIRALATSQLSGADITVVANVTHGLGEDTVLPTALQAFETDNPAVVAADMLLNPLYGMSATNPYLTIDVPAFVTWAQFCDQQAPNADGTTSRRFVFAGVFDQSGSNAWQCLQQVASMARAQIVPSGNSFTVWVDAPTDVTQVFTEANMIKGSYSESFIDYDSRAACIEAEFADAARSWRTDLPVSVMTAATINSGQQPKIARTSLLGCTSRDQAWRWAYFHLVTTETLLRTATWRCGVEALSARNGSVVGVQQRQWAYGGRVGRGSTTSQLQVDRTDLPAYTANAGWTVCVTHPIVLRGQATLASAASVGNGQTLLTFATALPNARIMRCSNGSGTECAVSAISQSNGVNGTSLTGAVQGAGFSSGQVVSLYDYDVMDVQVVSGVNGSVVTTAGSFLQAPTSDAPWLYGQSGGTAPYKLFRVTSIRQSADFQLEISGLDYNPACYEEVQPVYGAVFTAPTSNAGVSGFTLTETLSNTTLGNSKSPDQALITASWSNGPNTAGSDIYGQVDGGVWNHMAHVTTNHYSFTATTADVWSIRVVGFDRLGVASNYSTAPVQTITVQGTGVAPVDVLAFSGTPSGSQTILTWGSGTTKVGVTAPGRSGDTYILGQQGTLGGPPSAAFYEIRFSPTSSTGWASATLVATGVTGTTYTDTTPRVGTYMIKAISATGVESISPAYWSTNGSSSALNGQGSIVPTQAIPVTYSLTSQSNGTWSMALEVTLQTVLFSDGSSITVPNAILGPYSLQASTTYYIYTYISVVDGSLNCTSGAPATVPPTSPSSTLALMSSSDGRIAGPLLVVTTGAAQSGGSSGSPVTGGGYGGSGSTCPEAAEMVYVEGRGIVPAGTVEPAERLAGWSFRESRHVTRTVRAVRHQESEIWHIVEGHRVSPQHPVMTYSSNETWQLPYRIGKFDRYKGVRVKIELEEEEYNEQNYWIAPTAGYVEPLLMHNVQIAPC